MDESIIHDMVFGRKLTEEQEKENKAKLDLIFGSSNTYKKDDNVKEKENNRVFGQSTSNDIFDGSSPMEELLSEPKEMQIAFKDLDINQCEIRYNLWDEEYDSLSIYYIDEYG